MTAPDRWGRHGDAYTMRGARGQLLRLRFALGDEQRAAFAVSLRPDTDALHRAAWRVGHHAGRVFLARDVARGVA